MSGRIEKGGGWVSYGLAFAFVVSKSYGGHRCFGGALLLPSTVSDTADFYVGAKAGEGVRTLDFLLGKQAL